MKDKIKSENLNKTKIIKVVVVIILIVLAIFLITNSLKQTDDKESSKTADSQFNEYTNLQTSSDALSSIDETLELLD